MTQVIPPYDYGPILIAAIGSVASILIAFLTAYISFKRLRSQNVRDDSEGVLDRANAIQALQKAVTDATVENERLKHAIEVAEIEHQTALRKLRDEGAHNIAMLRAELEQLKGVVYGPLDITVRFATPPPRILSATIAPVPDKEMSG